MKQQPYIYPSNWIRRLDFLAPLRLQAQIDPKLELYHLDAVVTTSSAVPTVEDDRGEFGIIRIDATTGNRIHYIKGHPDARKAIRENTPVSQKELLEDILSRGFEGPEGNDMPGVVIQDRGSVEPISDRVRREVEPLQSSEHILRLEGHSGTYTKMLRERTHIHSLFDTYQYTKTELLTRGYVRTQRDPVLRQLRSVLKTEKLVPEDTSKGCDDLGPRLLTIEQAGARDKWWKTIGYPVSFDGTADHTLIKGQLLHLPEHGAALIV